jgi:hypothetical protein
MGVSVLYLTTCRVTFRLIARPARLMRRMIRVKIAAEA